MLIYFVTDTADFKVKGKEDCLYLDITVPGGVAERTNMSVMIWIHGGGSIVGGGSIYNGAPLAVQGDVIVVSINYRLGLLGFLADDNMGKPIIVITASSIHCHSRGF